MKLPSTQDHVFSQVPQAQIQRSVFNRDHSHKTMFNSGYLIPFYVDEVLPGDTFCVSATLFTRMPSALNLPVMDNLFLDTFYFFVPNRLLWANFKKFCGEQDQPNDSTSYTVPQVTTSSGFVVEGLADYFGLPLGCTNMSVNALPFRAYNLIWNKWFRDQNLQTPVTEYTDDASHNISAYTLKKRGKRHDYFTSCLPWAQKGTAVNLPLGSVAPVIGIGKIDGNFTGSGVAVTETGGGSATYTYGQTIYPNITELPDSHGSFAIKGNAATSGYPQIYADLTNATAATINSLRQAFQIQRMYERDARGGTRYTEIVLAHFGVTSPDARQQRPEFLGGRSTPINITSVPQTSAATSQPTPQGNLAAYALGLNTADGFVKSFTEHGILIGLCSVRADLTYQQGVPRMFSRSTRFDFYWPALANLGEQAVLNQEIYAVGISTVGDANDLQNKAPFGYQERWAEYRYYPSKITGKLRSTYSTPLDAWHLSQKFLSLPTLSTTFIEETPPISRIVAVTTEPEFVMDAYIQCRCVRPMPTYSVPGLIDHF